MFLRIDLMELTSLVASLDHDRPILFVPIAFRFEISRDVSDEHARSFSKPLNFLLHPRGAAVGMQLIEGVARDGQNGHGAGPGGTGPLDWYDDDRSVRNFSQLTSCKLNGRFA